VLIVDDEEDIRELARISLERVGGMSVLVAGSGPDGIEVAARERPDAIVLDAMMPGMDGPATLEQLRANPATAEIPVVFLTGSVQASDREHYVGLGARGLISKPFDPMTLADELRRCLGWAS
jgi:CheY-like chemotaxis protein